MAVKCEKRESSFCVLSSKRFPCKNESVPVFASYSNMAKSVKCMLGQYKISALFLSHNDRICLLSVDDLRQEESYTIHFFIPK